MEDADIILARIVKFLHENGNLYESQFNMTAISKHCDAFFGRNVLTNRYNNAYEINEKVTSRYPRVSKVFVLCFEDGDRLNYGKPPRFVFYDVNNKLIKRPSPLGFDSSIELFKHLADIFYESGVLLLKILKFHIDRLQKKKDELMAFEAITEEKKTRMISEIFEVPTFQQWIQTLRTVIDNQNYKGLELHELQNFISQEFNSRLENILGN